MTEYTADDLQILKLHEGVRLRPSMYFGSVDSRGINAALKSLIEVCVDEYRVSHSTLIEVTQTRDGFTVIADDGNGVRVDSPPEFRGRSFLEVALTEFLVNGFGIVKRYTYDSLPAPPAVAAEFHLVTHRDGRCYSIGFTEGLITQPFTDDGPSKRRGTTMRWKPDPAVFQSHAVDTGLLKQHLEILAAVYRGLQIRFCDENTGETATFLYLNGCSDLLRTKNIDQPVAYPVISIQMECDDVKFDLAFQHILNAPTRIQSYVNAGITENGSHVQGFLSGLASSIREMGSITGIENVAEVDSNSVLAGLTAELSIIADNAFFESPTRSTLHNPEIGVIIAKQVSAKVLELCTSNPSLKAALTRSVTRG